MFLVRVCLHVLFICFLNICSLFPLCMESKAQEKSTSKSDASKFFACNPSIILWLQAYGLLKETVTALTTLYINTKEIVR